MLQEVTGRFLAPDGSPLSGSVVFTPTFLFARDREAVTLPAPVTAKLDAEGRVAASLLVPSPDTEPDAWVWEACPQLRGKHGVVRLRDFAFELTADAPVNLAEVTPVPTSTGEYVTRGEKGDTPTEEDIRPVVESILPGAIEEAVRPLAPSIADSYPPNGDIALEDGKTLHILSLDGEARISFPTAGSPGESFILAIVRGAEYATIPGRDKLTSADSPRSLWLSVVHDGAKWLPVPGQDSGAADMFDKAVENWKERFHDSIPHLDALDQQNIIDTIVESVGWVRTFSRSLADNWMAMNLGALAPGWDGRSTRKATDGLEAAGYFYDQYQAMVEVIWSMRTLTGFFEWMATNLPVGQPSSQEDAHRFFPSSGYSAIVHNDGVTAALMPGDAYEVVGLDEGSPRLRVRIRPYADETYEVYRQNGSEPIPHKHVGEVYEVPLVRVEDA